MKFSFCIGAGFRVRKSFYSVMGARAGSGQLTRHYGRSGTWRFSARVRSQLKMQSVGGLKSRTQRFFAYFQLKMTKSKVSQHRTHAGSSQGNSRT